MPSLNSAEKQKIALLPHDELCKIIFQHARKNKEFYRFLNVNYFNPEEGKENLLEETKKEIDKIWFKGAKGRSQQQIWANKITKAIRLVNEFVSVTKDKKAEADLLIYIVDDFFMHYANDLGTCFTAYDTKLATTVRKIINIVEKNLHPDFKVEYEDKINNYLAILHKRSNHLDVVYDLPQKIDD